MTGDLTDGERWTVDALLELRRGGYTTVAWREFLVGSLRRAATTRRARPELARQANCWSLVGAMSWVAVSGRCASPRGVAPRTVAGLLWWATVSKMLEWHLGMTEGPSGEARARLSSADAVTLVRFWLAAIAPLARRSRYGLPAVIVVGGLSDWVDGALARRAGSTRLGRDLDTAADIAFFGAAAVSAAAARRLPAFSACALIGRYAAGTALTVRAMFRSGRRPPQDAARWGAILRVTGLVLATAGWRRAGAAAVAAGSLAPARSRSGR